MSFADDAARLFARAGLGRADGWDAMPGRPRQHVSPELAAQRRAGRAAYERAMAARGVPEGIYASAHYFWDDDDD